MAKRKNKKNKKTRRKSSPSTFNKALSPKNYNQQDIPVYNFFEDHNNADPEINLIESLDSFMFWMEENLFFLWEAVECKEQGLPLSTDQQNALDELLSFSDDESEPILYINESARPAEPWYETVNKIVPKLILEPFKTYEVHNEIYHEGWPKLVDCLNKYAQKLSRPENISSPVEVIPATIRHRLWLQVCFDPLSGLGQDDDLTLVDNEQKLNRIDWFLESLKEHKNSVEFFDLSLKKLFEFVKLPPADEKILTDSLIKKLKLESVSEKIKNFL